MLQGNHTINPVSGRRSQPTATRNGNELSEQVIGRLPLVCLPFIKLKCRQVHWR
ncbi:hypothetical protein [Nostoc sp.]|uniref:hypothetical protein n=1 Tax=Nostoc sp. TaxID=1180 RepID=UPI002FF7A84C